MATDIGYGLKRPGDGDKGDKFWDELENLFNWVVAHTHDGTNSPSITDSGVEKGIVTLSSSDWAANPTLPGYRQTITTPSGFSIDNSSPYFVVVSGAHNGKRIYPSFERVTSTSITVYVNDNSLELQAIFL